MTRDEPVVVMTNEEIKAEIESSQKVWENFMKLPIPPGTPSGNVVMSGINDAGQLINLQARDFPVVPIAYSTHTGTNTSVYPAPEINQERRVRVTAAEMKETGSRKAFRKLLGDRLNNIYQDLLQIWGQEHPEATE